MKRLQLLIAGLFSLAGGVSMCLMVSVKIIKNYGYTVPGLISLVPIALGLLLLAYNLVVWPRYKVFNQEKWLRFVRSILFAIRSILSIFMVVYGFINLTYNWDTNIILMNMSDNLYIMTFVLCNIFSAAWFLAAWPKKLENHHWLNGWPINKE